MTSLTAREEKPPTSTPVRRHSCDRSHETMPRLSATSAREHNGKSSDYKGKSTDVHAANRYGNASTLWSRSSFAALRRRGGRTDCASVGRHRGCGYRISQLWWASGSATWATRRWQMGSRSVQPAATRLGCGAGRQLLAAGPIYPRSGTIASIWGAPPR